MSVPTIVLAAGGTGGHLFPAESLARELKQRGMRVELISDHRVREFATSFPADAIHEVRSGTVTGKGLVGKATGIVSLGFGVLECRGLLKRLRPDAVVGFGGYPTVPPVLAATMLKIPSILHEQNAVMGRANTFLAKRVMRVATGFPLGGATVHVGNPVRASVLDAAQRGMPPISMFSPLNVLVFGGSQGARIMSDVVPPALALLSPEQRKRLSVTQQVRPEDLAEVKARYAELGIPADCAAFFRDLPQRMAASHLVISRSGASTVAELSVIGRASLLVPLPGSLDQDQAANAAILEKSGGAIILPQKTDFTPPLLAERLAAIISAPEILSSMAVKAKAIGIDNAASRLADLVLEVAALANSAKATS